MAENDGALNEILAAFNRQLRGPARYGALNYSNLSPAERDIAFTIAALPSHARVMAQVVANDNGLTPNGLTDRQRRLFERVFDTQENLSGRETTSPGLMCALGQASAYLHHASGEYINNDNIEGLSYWPRRAGHANGIIRRGSTSGPQPRATTEITGNISAGLNDAVRTANELRRMAERGSITDPQWRALAANMPEIVQAMTIQQIEAWRQGSPVNNPSVLVEALQNGGQVPERYRGATVVIRDRRGRERELTGTQAMLALAGNNRLVNRDNIRINFAGPSNERVDNYAERQGYPPPPTNQGATGAGDAADEREELHRRGVSATEIAAEVQPAPRAGGGRPERGTTLSAADAQSQVTTSGLHSEQRPPAQGTRPATGDRFAGMTYGEAFAILQMEMADVQGGARKSGVVHAEDVVYRAMEKSPALRELMKFSNRDSRDHSINNPQVLEELRKRGFANFEDFVQSRIAARPGQGRG
ncbi:MAG: hypothetical protein FWF01_03670 [Alphaproteobacteria bacterium]|nr:hypothetical protein [Alphaproteobacteria bacterium]